MKVSTIKRDRCRYGHSIGKIIHTIMSIIQVDVNSLWFLWGHTPISQYYCSKYPLFSVFLLTMRLDHFLVDFLNSKYALGMVLSWTYHTWHKMTKWGRRTRIITYEWLSKQRCWDYKPPQITRKKEGCVFPMIVAHLDKKIREAIMFRLRE